MMLFRSKLGSASAAVGKLISKPRPQTFVPSFLSLPGSLCESLSSRSSSRRRSGYDCAVVYRSPKTWRRIKPERMAQKAWSAVEEGKGGLGSWDGPRFPSVKPPPGLLLTRHLLAWLISGLLFSSSALLPTWIEGSPNSNLASFGSTCCLCPYVRFGTRRVSSLPVSTQTGWAHRASIPCDGDGWEQLRGVEERPR